MFATGLLLAGMILYGFMAVAVTIYAFKISIAQGFLCLILPLYVYFFAKKRSTPAFFMTAWYLGIACLICGTLLKSL